MIQTKVVLVCDGLGDKCGELAFKTVNVSNGSRTAKGTRLKDLCEDHYRMLMRGARLPKRGNKRV